MDDIKRGVTGLLAFLAITVGILATYIYLIKP